MRLYHFTNALRVASILEAGLCPHVPDPEFMTLSRPVVWLTTAETMALTPTDIEWMEARGCYTEQEMDAFKTKGMVHGDNPCRIEVRLEHSKRLVHYATWLGRQTCPINGAIAKRQLTCMGPSTRAHWYVYFGNVQHWRLGDILALNADASAVMREIANRLVAA